MNRLFKIAIGVSAMALVSLVSAQATRTWVSGVGDDVNPASRTAPAKTFAGAISKTAAGGEISVLDPGGYGAVTITKSLTIDGLGTLASILHSGTTGVIVSALSTDHIVLRNLTINGGSGGLSGVRVLQAASVTLENVTIEGVSVAGVNVEPTASAVSIYLRNVTIRRGLGTSTTVSGVLLSGANGNITAHLENVSISGYQRGIDAGANSVVHVDRSSIIGNAVGIRAAVATAIVRLSDSTVTGNTTGLSYATALLPPAPDTPGQIISYNNNRLRGNTTDGVPTSAVYTR
jgi:hypothetical protein